MRPMRANSLSMTEHETSLVKQPIYAKLDTGLDDPSEGPIMMIRNIGYQERVVRPHRNVVGHGSEGSDILEGIRELERYPQEISRGDGCAL